MFCTSVIHIPKVFMESYVLLELLHEAATAEFHSNLEEPTMLCQYLSALANSAALPSGYSSKRTIGRALFSRLPFANSLIRKPLDGVSGVRAIRETLTP